MYLQPIEPKVQALFCAICSGKSQVPDTEKFWHELTNQEIAQVVALYRQKGLVQMPLPMVMKIPPLFFKYSIFY